MSRTFLTASAGLLVVLTACVPVVAHGPRVEPGLSGGASASVTAGPRYNNGDDGPSPFLYGPLGVNAGYGWTSGSDGGGPAVRFGVHVPVLVVLVQPDLYVQAPRRALGGFDAGIGVSAPVIDAGRVAMPYVQLGRITDTGSGWYTTQGFFFNRRNPGFGAGTMLREKAWVPTIAYQYGGGRTTTHVFATGAFGRQLLGCKAFTNAMCNTESRWSVMTGLTVERHRRHEPMRQRGDATSQK